MLLQNLSKTNSKPASGPITTLSFKPADSQESEESKSQIVIQHEGGEVLSITDNMGSAYGLPLRNKHEREDRPQRSSGFKDLDKDSSSAEPTSSTEEFLPRGSISQDDQMDRHRY